MRKQCPICGCPPMEGETGDECPFQEYHDDPTSIWPELPPHFVPDGPGRWIMSGYVVLYRPYHPLANDRGTVLEHRMVLHDAGIEVPPDYDVHHRNRRRDDNRLSNLELIPRTVHHELHGRERRGRTPGT